MKDVCHLILFISFASSVFAEWKLIDDFSAFSDGQFFTNAADIGWHASATANTEEYWMIADPHNRDNICLFIESGGYGISYSNTFCQKELPGEGIAPGETGTLFWRGLWSGTDDNWSMGTADQELEYDPVTGMQTVPGAWGDFNALIRLGMAQDLEHRDGGEFVSTNPPVVLNVNIWYNFWMVVENTWDSSTNPPTSTGVYSLYLQSPEGALPVLIPVGTDPPKEKADFRRDPVDADGNPQAIIWLQFATNSRAMSPTYSGDPYLLDDFYFSKGTNLSNPLLSFGEWAGYQMLNDEGDLFSDGFLGWLNAGSAPFLYQYDVGWIYMAEPAGSSEGAWGFFYK